MGWHLPRHPSANRVGRLKEHAKTDYFDGPKSKRKRFVYAR